jgi:hypothetical protein
MDPFLESPDVFPDLHDSLISGIRDAVNSQLRPPYYSAIASRVLVEFSDRLIGPDVNVLFGGDENSPSANGGGTATVVDVEPVVIHVPHDEIRELSLEIRTTGDERLVTAIEVLSLSNKMPGENRRDLYLKKQKEILESRVHLVEIDLLRAGEHSTAVPLNRTQRKTGRFDYHVCIHRFDNLEDYVVYPILLQSRLPKIGIPLLPGDADVTIDLQAIFDRCYDAALYARRVRYSEKSPIPPLSGQQDRWMKELLGRRVT